MATFREGEEETRLPWSKAIRQASGVVVQLSSERPSYSAHCVKNSSSYVSSSERQLHALKRCNYQSSKNNDDNDKMPTRFYKKITKKGIKTTKEQIKEIWTIHGSGRAEDTFFSVRVFFLYDSISLQQKKEDLVTGAEWVINVNLGNGEANMQP